VCSLKTKGIYEIDFKCIGHIHAIVSMYIRYAKDDLKNEFVLPVRPVCAY